MPIIKSAKKRMRQTIVRRSRNQATKRTLREESKVFAAAVVAKAAPKKKVVAKKPVAKKAAPKKTVAKKPAAKK